MILTAVDEELRIEAGALIKAYGESMKALAFHKALMAIWEYIGKKVNKYIVTTEPWVLAKSDKIKVSHGHLSHRGVDQDHFFLLSPVMPETSEKIQHLLGLPRKGGDLGLQEIREWGSVKPSRGIAKAPHLFQRIGPESPKEGRGRKKAEMKKEDLANRVSIKEFQKLDLRVGTIKSVEPVAGSKKLLKILPVGSARFTRGLSESLTKGFKDYYKKTYDKDITITFLSPGGWPVCVDKVRTWGDKPDADIFGRRRSGA